MTAAPTPPLVPGRSCDGCTMCCKIMGIAEIAKPRLQWCPHCDIGKGCKIYETRPESCRLFYCHFLQDARIGEHWKPSKSRMLLIYNATASRLSVNVDPDRPGAWRLRAFSEDGHGLDIHIDAQSVRASPAGAGSGAFRALRIGAGLAVILALFAVVGIVIRRR